MENVLEIFEQDEIIEAYKACRVGDQKFLLYEFICHINFLIIRLRKDAGIYKTNDRQLFRLAIELISILQQVLEIIVPPEDNLPCKEITIVERLDASLICTEALLENISTR